eukprot:scaffold167874_cov68-Attheya_sp.AAC.4
MAATSMGYLGIVGSTTSPLVVLGDDPYIAMVQSLINLFECYNEQSHSVLTLWRKREPFFVNIKVLLCGLNLNCAVLFQVLHETHLLITKCHKLVNQEKRKIKHWKPGGEEERPKVMGNGVAEGRQQSSEKQRSYFHNVSDSVAVGQAPATSCPPTTRGHGGPAVVHRSDIRVMMCT